MYGIGGQHGDDRVRAGAPLGGDRAQADGGRGVARHRLDDDVGGGQIREGGAHRVRLIGGGDDQRVLGADDGAAAPHGGRDQRLGRAERQELLGARAAARRPQPRARAAAQNDGECLPFEGMGSAL